MATTLLPIITWAYRENFKDFCLSDKSLSDKYECLFQPINNIFLPISIYAYHYFHQSGAFATGKSDFQFPFTFWLIFGKFSFNFFPKNSVTKTKTEYQKSAESWNQTKNCKTIFQKSAKIQKCSYKQKNHLPNAKNETDS